MFDPLIAEHAVLVFIAMLPVLQMPIERLHTWSIHPNQRTDSSLTLHLHDVEQGMHIDSDRLLVFGGGAFLLLVASIFFVRQGKGSASKKEAGAVAVTAAAATAAPVAVAVAIEP